MEWVIKRDQIWKLSLSRLIIKKIKRVITEKIPKQNYKVKKWSLYGRALITYIKESQSGPISPEYSLWNK